MVPGSPHVARRAAPWLVASLLTTVLALAVTVGPSSAAAATCSDYDTQAEAQRASDTRDADGDGVYCEALPCPCARPGGNDRDGDRPTPQTRGACVRPRGVRTLVFSRSAYPNIRRHTERAIRAGWPRVLVVNRRGADARRDRLLQGVPTRAGFDRDEYPPAVGRGRANGSQRGLVRGSMPRG